MRKCDVVIVGGGPGGSACAWELKRQGLDTVVLDRATFPRLKLCAGWVTPQVIEDLRLDINKYPHGFMTFDRIHAHIKGLKLKLNTTQHSIRRYEFDNYLLGRSISEVHQHHVKKIERKDGCYWVDNKFCAPYIVGAGGTKCPVYRTLFRESNPRAKELQTVTFEHEFSYDWEDPDCHLWFFMNGLPGYSWYVPKANGYVNVGIGGMADKLKRKGGDIKTYWRKFIEMLGTNGKVRNVRYEPTGYSYYVRGNVDQIRVDNAFIVGDSIGLATRDLCEGIGPAVHSGIEAARAISHGHTYDLQDLIRHSAENRLLGKVMERLMVGRQR